MGNWVDRAVAIFSPERALRRHAARRALSYYEAAQPTTRRNARRERGGPDTASVRAGQSLREQARHLEQNHDLARGILDTLVQNIVGPNGIGIEPQPRRSDGSIHEELATQIQRLLRDWTRRPEVTWEHDWPAAQRLLARAWCRDGEALSQMLPGTIRHLDHGTRIPFSLELLEADLLPLEHHDPSRNITAGVERNAWGRPTRYWVYRDHPADPGILSRHRDLKWVPASRILHPKMVDRIRQVRGVSVFASVLARLDDVKDYEESERIAAKVAASMAAYIKKGHPEMYAPDDDEEPRELKFQPGMIFDDLALGEEIGTIDTSRPNQNLEAHRRGQLRAVASGTGVTYSSAAKDYDGTYSAQRQELVEGWGAYGVLANQFIGQFIRPVYERLIATAVASGQLSLPGDLLTETLDDALYVPPQMPWIDPDKEAKAMERLEANVHSSGPEIIRRRGQNPRDVLEQEAWWQRQLRSNEVGPGQPDPAADEEEETNDADDANARARTQRRR